MKAAGLPKIFKSFFIALGYLHTLWNFQRVRPPLGLKALILYWSYFHFFKFSSSRGHWWWTYACEAWIYHCYCFLGHLISMRLSVSMNVTQGWLLVPFRHVLNGSLFGKNTLVFPSPLTFFPRLTIEHVRPEKSCFRKLYTGCIHLYCITRRWILPLLNIRGVFKSITIFADMYDRVNRNLNKNRLCKSKSVKKIKCLY